MDSELVNPLMNNQDEKLASGDASSTDYLALSPSLTDLLPNPNTELQEKKNIDIWKYEGASPDSLPRDRCTPKFFPIGSLRKTQYQDLSKRACRINLNKSPKREIKLLDRNNKSPKGSHSNECFTQGSQPALNFVKLAKLFSCQACHASPMTSTTVHMCKQGHQVCGNCFDHNSRCEECGEPLDGRNNPVETALQKLKQLRPELFFQECFTLSNAEDSDEDGHSKAVHQLSHKPVQCPHLACRSTVAYNGILLHFKFEHSEVPVVSTTPDCLHQVLLQESLLNYTSATVVMVFKVNIVKRKSKKFDGDPVICCLLSVPLRIGCVKRLAVWCSSLHDDGTSPPLTYTLTSSNSRRSTVYQGPMASLHESTESVLKDGRCLIVPPEMIDNFLLQNESSNVLQIEFFINN